MKGVEIVSFKYLSSNKINHQLATSPVSYEFFILKDFSAHLACSKLLWVPVFFSFFFYI